MGFGGDGGIRRHLCRNSEAKEFTLKDERHLRKALSNKNPNSFLSGFGVDGEIRTREGFLPNAFRVRLVMTTSIRLRKILNLV